MEARGRYYYVVSIQSVISVPLLRTYVERHCDDDDRKSLLMGHEGRV